MVGALEGVKVLDCTQIIAGPLAGALLAEMGAEVLHVEPLEGEPWRTQAEVLPKESRPFLYHNRGKLGIAIDLKHPAAEPARVALLKWADVLITNYRPGVPEALKIDYASARAVRPDIIFCECTAFGKRGPDGLRRGFDLVAQAMSGVATGSPNTVNGVPQTISFAPSDVVTAAALAWAITAALYHRLRTGEGQAISGSLLHTSMSFLPNMREIVALDEEPRRQRLDQLAELRGRGASIEEVYVARRKLMPELTGNIYYRIYQTKDSYLAVGCLGAELRTRFREAIGLHDPRYEDGFDYDPANVAAVGDALVAEAEAIMRTRSNADWIAFLDTRHVPCGPMRFVDELWDDPQVVANDYIEEFEHPLFGTLRQIAPIIRMSATPTRIVRPSPALGQHTDEVLNRLGFSAAAISEMRTSGAIL